MMTLQHMTQNKGNLKIWEEAELACSLAVHLYCSGKYATTTAYDVNHLQKTQSMLVP